MLNWIQQWCPQSITDCLSDSWLSLKKKFITKQKKSYDGLVQFQQEQFQISSHNKEQSILSQMRPQKQNQCNGISEFKINLNPYDPYYNTIRQNTKNASQLLSMTGTILIDKKDKARMKIEELPTQKGFKFILKYTLPCTYEYYSTLSRNTNLFKSFNHYIQNLQLVESVYPNLRIINMSFKKFVLLQPRFFHYLKYQNSVNGNHWQICISLDTNSEGKGKNCDLVSIGYITEEDKKINIQTHLEVDLKSTMKAHKVLLRGLNEITSYIDTIYEYIKENYEKQNTI